MHNLRVRTGDTEIAGITLNRYDSESIGEHNTDTSKCNAGHDFMADSDWLRAGASAVGKYQI